MTASTIARPSDRLQLSAALGVGLWMAAGLLLFWAAGARADEAASESGTAANTITSDPSADVDNAVPATTTLTLGSVSTVGADPFAAQPAVYIPFDLSELPAPVDTTAYFPEAPSSISEGELVFLEPPANSASGPLAGDTNAANGEELPPQQSSADPCSRVTEKPLGELGINISVPSGQMPTDFAAACWEYRNSRGYDTRSWPVLPYFWDATCLCYRPLYFEEINLERHGYGCCCCLQPAASAAHFFATIPALPYCMAEHCPCECEYTLGHYRPGSCPPWRHHWPSCRPLAAATEAGVMTGLIFAIP